MALIACSECGKQVSDEAKTCPQCGAKIKKPYRWTWWRIMILVSVILAIGIPEYEKAKQKTAEAAKSPEQRATEAKQKAKEKQLNYARTVCQLALEKILHDPDSAKLERTYSWYAVERKDGTILVQPTGRAKNAFGAYRQGTWNCVAKPIGNDLVNDLLVVSLKQLNQ